jgi:hypothetical protein
VNSRLLNSVSVAQKSLSPETIRPYLLVIAALQLFLFIQVTALNEYFGIDTLWSLSWIADDGWCDILAGEAIGKHCFGDYAYVHSAIQEAKFWEEPYNFGYPAAAFAPAAVSFALGNLFNNYSVGLWFYLLALAVSLSSLWAIMIAANKNFLTSDKFVALFSIGPLSLPSLIAFDRGNTVGFFVPGILLIVIGVLSSNRKFVAYAIVFGCLLKPQFAILLLFFIIHRQWRLFFGSVAAAGTLHGLAYLVLVGELLHPLQRTLSVAVNFANDAGGAPAHKNISIAGSLDIIGRGLFDISSGQTKLITSVIVASLALGLIILGSRVTPVKSMTALLIISMIGAPVAFSYYLLFAQAIILIWHAPPKTAPSVFEKEFWSTRIVFTERLLQLTVFVAIATSLSGLLFPWIATGETTVDTSQGIASPFWLIVLLLIVVQPLVFRVLDRRGNLPIKIED